MNNTIHQPGRIAALRGTIFLCVLLLLALLSATPFFRQWMGMHRITSTTLVISRLVFWLITGLIWLYSKKIDKLPLLAWPEEKYGLRFYLLAFVTMWLVLVLGSNLIQYSLSAAGFKQKSDLFAVVIKIFKVNFPLLVFTCLTAGITEEFIFRGFLLPRLQILFKNHWAAIIVSSLLFGIMHAGWGTILNVAVPFFIGICFGFYYWKYRNIKFIIVFHFLWDLTILLLATRSH